MLFNRKINKSAGPAAVAAVWGMIFLIGACSSPIMPEDGEADIVISNDYGESLEIYLNGEFLYVLDHNRSVEMDNVAFGIYRFEARDPDTGGVVASKELDVEVRSDYYWLIDDPPDIDVTNESGVALKIFMEGEYQFDLVDEENRWILDVPYGEHLLRAVRVSDDFALASITVKVEEDTDYAWTIE